MGYVGVGTQPVFAGASRSWLLPRSGARSRARLQTREKARASSSWRGLERALDRFVLVKMFRRARPKRGKGYVLLAAFFLTWLIVLQVFFGGSLGVQKGGVVSRRQEQVVAQPETHVVRDLQVEIEEENTPVFKQEKKTEIRPLQDTVPSAPLSDVMSPVQPLVPSLLPLRTSIPSPNAAISFAPSIATSAPTINSTEVLDTARKARGARKDLINQTKAGRKKKRRSISNSLLNSVAQGVMVSAMESISRRFRPPYHYHDFSPTKNYTLLYLEHAKVQLPFYFGDANSSGAWDVFNNHYLREGGFNAGKCKHTCYLSWVRGESLWSTDLSIGEGGPGHCGCHNPSTWPSI